ncbi:toxin [Janibacter alittae]|uniref:Toxin n=1 Tax=Janibacter alittae TaxID=3115209 RepID=A0ABZ2MIL7_9MICO
MKVHNSALRQGVLPEDAVQAADWPLWVEPIDDEDWPHRELRLGFDTQAHLLEIVVLNFESGDEMVIHAMPARKQYWDLLP